MNQKIAHDSKHHDTDRTSVVITRHVRSGCEAAYEALLHGLLEDTKGFSGFQGGQVVRPTRAQRLDTFRNRFRCACPRVLGSGACWIYSGRWEVGRSGVN